MCRNPNEAYRRNVLFESSTPSAPRPAMVAPDVSSPGMEYAIRLRKQKPVIERAQLKLAACTGEGAPGAWWWGHP
jgi:hypothetical protein